jgi:hypothetical protein
VGDFLPAVLTTTDVFLRCTRRGLLQPFFVAFVDDT